MFCRRGSDAILQIRLFGKLSSAWHLRGSAPPEGDLWWPALFWLFSLAEKRADAWAGGESTAWGPGNLPIFSFIDLCQVTPSLPAIQRRVGMALGWFRE